MGFKEDADEYNARKDWLESLPDEIEKLLAANRLLREEICRLQDALDIAFAGIRMGDRYTSISGDAILDAQVTLREK